MRVIAAFCTSCKMLVFSRAHHDCRWCSCHSIYVDGGPDLERIGYRDELPQTVSFNLPISIKILYDDYAYGNDMYGCIPAQEIGDTGIVRARIGGGGAYLLLHGYE